jgi:hypothetical protein
MRRKMLYLVAILLIFTAFGFSNNVLGLSASHSANTTDEKEIKRTIERAYDITAEAAYNFDLRKFPEVFINDPRFPVPASTLQVVREMTNNLSLESAGYLDYKVAYFTHWRDGAILLESIQAKAKEEKRKLTKEESDLLIDSYGRPAGSRAQKPTRNQPIEIISIEITGDIAFAIVNDGPTTSQLTLVLVDEKWYIAGSSILSVHP